MSTGSEANPNTREFITQILDESQWPTILGAIVQLLSDKGVESVAVEFGFLLERDLRGEKHPENTVVPLASLQTFVDCGLEQGTIEWGSSSDFRFSPIGLPLSFILCNDADLHFYSRDMALLLELTRLLSGLGIKVYDSGKLVLQDISR